MFASEFAAVQLNRDSKTLQKIFADQLSIDFFGDLNLENENIDAHNLSQLIRTSERRLQLHGTSHSPSRVLQLQSCLTLSV